MRLARPPRPGVRGPADGLHPARALVRMLACPRTMRELAADLATDTPYTSVVVDDLERRELVQRIAHPQDRRVKMSSSPMPADAPQRWPSGSKGNRRWLCASSTPTT